MIKNFIIDYDVFLDRAETYARILENLISPKDTYPAIGQSLTYKCGVFVYNLKLPYMKDCQKG